MVWGQRMVSVTFVTSQVTLPEGILDSGGRALLYHLFTHYEMLAKAHSLQFPGGTTVTVITAFLGHGEG